MLVCKICLTIKQNLYESIRLFNNEYQIHKSMGMKYDVNSELHH